MRSIFVFRVVIAILLTTTCVAGAQQQAIPRVGLLAGGHGFGAAGEVFRQSLRQLGWIVGQNIAIDSRLAEALPDQLPPLAAELVRLRIATIVADGDPAIAAARRVTATIPIVMVAIGDPVSEGFVSTLARPGANITGVTSVSTELSGKRLEIIREVSPAISQVGVVWNPGNASNSLEFKELDHMAPKLGVKLQSLEVRAVNDFRNVFARAIKDRVRALILVRDPIIRTFPNTRFRNRQPDLIHAWRGAIYRGRRAHVLWP